MVVRLRFFALAGVLGLAVTACGGAVTARPAGVSDRPPHPAPAIAQTVDLQDALAVSPDGSQIAVDKDDKFCVRLRIPEGARGSSAVCSEDVENPGSMSAVFSPDGGRVVVFDDPQYASGGHAWIVSGASGATVAVKLPPAASTSTTSSRSTGAAVSEVAWGFLWQSQDALFAVGFFGAVYRVTPSTGAAVMLTPGGDKSTEAVMQAALGGGMIALVLEGASEGHTRLVTVAVDSGTVRDPAVIFEQGVSRPVLLGVSPDGSEVLLSTGDLKTQRPGETAIYTLATGQRVVIPGSKDTLVAAGAFTSDGSTIALVATGAITGGQARPPVSADGQRYHLQLAPADGSAPARNLIGADAEAQALDGPLVWSSGGFLSSAGNPSSKAAAWTIQTPAG